MRSATLALLTLFIASFAAAEVRTMSIESRSLRGNALGDPSSQSFAVYLPPDYQNSTTRYPVIYLLHGIGDSFKVWTDAWKIPQMLDRLIAEKKIAPVIV